MAFFCFKIPGAARGRLGNSFPFFRNSIGQDETTLKKWYFAT
jgi:hypothetical protein